MSDFNIWNNYANHNQHMAWGDTNDADRRYHEQERQRAEDRAREERAREERSRRDAEDRQRRADDERRRDRR
jgi:hypothetical protein